MKNFPDRDTTKPAEKQGMFRKFEVRRLDGSDKPGGKHHGCRYFVLDLDHDPHAAAAMAAYGQARKETHPALSAEISAEYPAPKPVAWIRRRTCDGEIADFLLDSQIEEVRKT